MLPLRTAKAAILGVIACGVTAPNTGLPKLDARTEKLSAFFDAYNCPAPHHVDEYLRAADEYALDYRILPAISVLESTCGAFERLNNRWGWDNSRSGFDSVAQGITFIAGQLAEAPAYRDKPLKEKLITYNPADSDYPRQVQRLMRQIDN